MRKDFGLDKETQLMLDAMILKTQEEDAKYFNAIYHALVKVIPEGDACRIVQYEMRHQGLKKKYGLALVPELQANNMARKANQARDDSLKKD